MLEILVKKTQGKTVDVMTGSLDRTEHDLEILVRLDAPRMKQDTSSQHTRDHGNTIGKTSTALTCCNIAMGKRGPSKFLCPEEHE